MSHIGPRAKRGMSPSTTTHSKSKLQGRTYTEPRSSPAMPQRTMEPTASRPEYLCVTAGSNCTYHGTRPDK